jgi:AbrB family looped-hinge helix DNA binding protein
MKTTIDAAGRLVIPKAIRESAGLRPGQEINVEYRDGKVEIEPAQQSMKLVRRGSRYVLVPPPGSPPLTEEIVRQTIEEIREERTRKILFGGR